MPGATGAAFPPLDVIFPVLHGPYGEDGTIQGLLEIAGIPYVGSGVLGSALGMDKAGGQGAFSPLRTCPRRRTWRSNARTGKRTRQAAIARIEGLLPYPVFVKPANLGSSIGINKAHDRAELRDALAEAARYDRKLLVEQAVPAGARDRVQRAG